MAEPLYQPTDRRPIASRQAAASRAAAAALVRIGVSPNAISLAGMAAALAAGAALAATTHRPDEARWLWLAAAAGAQLRLVANMLDGMVAIASARASPVGELYNEVPDRVSDAAVFIGLGYAAGGSPELGYLAALAAVFVAYVRTAARVAGAPQDYCGPMAKQHRMFVVTLAALYAALAPEAWRPEWGPDSLGVAAAALLIVIVGGAITAVRRLVRASRRLREGRP